MSGSNLQLRILQCRSPPWCSLWWLQTMSVHGNGSSEQNGHAAVRNDRSHANSKRRKQVVPVGAPVPHTMAGSAKRTNNGKRGTSETHGTASVQKESNGSSVAQSNRVQPSPPAPPRNTTHASTPTTSTGGTTTTSHSNPAIAAHPSETTTQPPPSASATASLGNTMALSIAETTTQGKVPTPTPRGRPKVAKKRSGKFPPCGFCGKVFASAAAVKFHESEHRDEDAVFEKLLKSGGVAVGGGTNAFVIGCW